MVAIMQCWFCLADDTFTSLRAEHIKPFHNWLNSIHPDIQWTYKIEKDWKLNMPDLTVGHRMAPYLLTSVESPHTQANIYPTIAMHHAHLSLPL
jgi:hypothetical protein